MTSVTFINHELFCSSCSENWTHFKIHYLEPIQYFQRALWELWDREDAHLCEGCQQHQFRPPAPLFLFPRCAGKAFDQYNTNTLLQLSLGSVSAMRAAVCVHLRQSIFIAALSAGGRKSTYTRRLVPFQISALLLLFEIEALCMCVLA